MNKYGVILAVVVTALLAGVAWWMTRPSATGAPAAPVMLLPAVDPTTVQTVQIVSARDRVESVRAGPLPNLWLITREPASMSQTAVMWVADTSIVRGAVRVLAEAKGEAVESAAGSTWGAGFPRVRLDLPGRYVQLEFGSELAGRVPVRVGTDQAPGGVTCMTPASLATMFTGDSMKAWRSKRLLPVESTPARVRVESGGQVCELSKAGGSWGVIRPAMGRGDDPVIAELLTRLAGLEVVRFADDGMNPREAGLTDSSPRIVVESDRRAVTGDRVERQTVAQELRIGGRADVAGQTVFVEASGRIVDPDKGGEIAKWGPVLGIAEASKLSSIATSPMAYVSRRTLNVPAVDVRRLEFMAPGPSGATPAPMTVIDRSTGVWTWTSGGDPAAPLPPEDAKMLDAFLKLICDERGAEVAAAGTTAAVPVAFARVTMGPDEPAKVLTVAATEAETGGAGWLIMSDEKLERRSPLRAWTGVVNWLRARVSVPR